MDASRRLAFREQQSKKRGSAVELCWERLLCRVNKRLRDLQGVRLGPIRSSTQTITPSSVNTHEQIQSLMNGDFDKLTNGALSYAAGMLNEIMLNGQADGESHGQSLESEIAEHALRGILKRLKGEHDPSLDD